MYNNLFNVYVFFIYVFHPYSALCKPKKTSSKTQVSNTTGVFIEGNTNKSCLNYGPTILHIN